MTTAALTLALLNMGHPGAATADFARARILAVTISAAARAHGIDPVILAAVAAHETAFHRDRVGKRGERGRWQVMPATAHLAGYSVSPEALANDPINADVAAWWLAHVRGVCSRHGHRTNLDAAALNAYRGAGCRTPNGRPSRYARQILDLAGMARAPADARPSAALVEYWTRINEHATATIATKPRGVPVHVETD